MSKQYDQELEARYLGEIYDEPPISVTTAMGYLSLKKYFIGNHEIIPPRSSHRPTFEEQRCLDAIRRCYPDTKMPLLKHIPYVSPHTLSKGDNK